MYSLRTSLYPKTHRSAIAIIAELWLVSWDSISIFGSLEMPTFDSLKIEFEGSDWSFDHCFYEKEVDPWKLMTEESALTWTFRPGQHTIME